MVSDPRASRSASLILKPPLQSPGVHWSPSPSPRLERFFHGSLRSPIPLKWKKLIAVASLLLWVRPDSSSLGRPHFGGIVEGQRIEGSGPHRRECCLCHR